MMATVSNNVGSVARQSGISLLEISRVAGVSYSMLRRIAAGRGNVCLCDAVALAHALDLPVERLFALETVRSELEPSRRYGDA